MSQSTRILIALIAGLVIGIVIAGNPSVTASGIAIAEPIGTAWLNALQMTIVPLVFALLVTGIAATAEAAKAGRLAGVSIILYTALLALSATVAAVLTPLILEIAPLPTESAAQLRAALTGVAPIGPTPPIGEFLAKIVPTNIIAAASENAFLSLIIFALVFAFAVTRIDKSGRDLLIGFFEAVRDAMLIVIDWVLWLAPIGVFALAFVVGARAGSAAFGALVHYILVVSAVGLIVSLAAYPIAVFGGRVSLARFARAALPSQAVAISTQSSLASLPAMIEGASELGTPVATSGVTLPLAVAIFRATGPAMNMAVAIYVATWFGVSLSPAVLAVAILVATLTSLGSVSLPGTISYVSAIAPITATLGAPVAPLGLLVAVETIPDIMRTLGNVMMDLATTITIYARGGRLPESVADATAAENSP